MATHKFALHEQTPGLFGELQSTGYYTGLIGKLHVNPERNFSKHIDFRAIKGADFGAGQRSIQKYAEAAADMFEQAGDKPFFLSINYPDAHFPLHRQDNGSPAEPLDADDITSVLPWIGCDSPELRSNPANYYN